MFGEEGMAGRGPHSEGEQQRREAASPQTRNPGVARSSAGRDPGDAVPPGVAPLDPPEPTEEDLRVLDQLRGLPRRGG
jgi:hypothetical protein